MSSDNEDEHIVGVGVRFELLGELHHELGHLCGRRVEAVELVLLLDLVLVKDLLERTTIVFDSAEVRHSLLDLAAWALLPNFVEFLCGKIDY